MALRNIVYDNDPKIRKKSKDVKDFDESLHQLLDDMKETMYHEDGMGISAVQIGVLKRVFIIEYNNMFIEFINPTISNTEGNQENLEGCLSVEKYNGLVKRPKKVTVTAFDRYNNKFSLTVEDYMAAAVCHENDHLEGVLFTDKAIKLYEKQESE